MVKVSPDDNKLLMAAAFAGLRYAFGSFIHKEVFSIVGVCSARNMIPERYNVPNGVLSLNNTSKKMGVWVVTNPRYVNKQIRRIFGDGPITVGTPGQAVNVAMVQHCKEYGHRHRKLEGTDGTVVYMCERCGEVKQTL